MSVLDSDLVELVSSDSPSGIGPRPEAILLANAQDGLEAAWLAGRLRRGEAATILHVAHDGARLRFLAGMVAILRTRDRDRRDPGLGLPAL